MTVLVICYNGRISTSGDMLHCWRQLLVVSLSGLRHAQRPLSAVRGRHLQKKSGPMADSCEPILIELALGTGPDMVFFNLSYVSLLYSLGPISR